MRRRRQSARGRLGKHQIKHAHPRFEFILFEFRICLTSVSSVESGFGAWSLGFFDARHLFAPFFPIMRPPLAPKNATIRVFTRARGPRAPGLRGVFPARV